MKKRILSVFLITLMLATVVGGAAAEGTSLTYWVKKTFSEENDKALEERVLQFGKEKGIEVVVEHIPSSNMAETFNAAIAAGTTPDVSFLTMQFVAPFHDQGLLADLTDVQKQIEAGGSPFIYEMAQIGYIDDGVYSLPLYGSPRVIIYREDLLKAAGYDAPPATWEEFREVAKATTDAAKGIYGFAQPLSGCDDFELNARSLLWSYGGAIYDENGNVAINSQKAAEAFQLWFDMYYEDGSIPPEAISWDDNGNNTAYLAGTAAMAINPNTILRALQKEEYADLLAVSKIAPVPTAPDGNRVIVGGGCFTGIFNATKDLETSKELLAYTFEPEWYANWLKDVSGEMTPVFSAMAEDPNFTDKEYTPMLIEQIGYFAYPGYPGAYTTTAANLLAAKQLGASVQEAIINKMSGAEFVAMFESVAESFK